MTRKSPQATSFAALALSPLLLQVTEELGYATLTPIQAQSIPLLLAGKDVVGQSKTGSGKTAAFSLPILSKLRPQGRLPQALILCPTRELCTQVAREIRKLGRRLPGLQVLILAGGQPLRPQAHALEKGVHVVVGTPGRVMDHLERKTLDLRQVATVVLDEADRMLDMGFQEDMEAILGRAPRERQTVFFSATYPQSIEAMSRAFQQRPVHVTIEDEASEAPAIRQLVCETPHGDKLKVLLWALRHHRPESSIIFCNHRATVNELTESLTEAGLSAAGLHGELEQRDRDKVMARFRNRSIRALVATDVAARGIDVEGVDVVFNYDLPVKPEVYVHRIGRTGRAGKTGTAISLATPREKHKIEGIEEFTSQTLQPLPAPGKDELDQPKTLAHEAQMVTLRISGGRKEKVRPGDILGALTGEAGGLEAAVVGKIEIHDHFAYVAVAKAVAKTALQRLQQGKIKGRRFNIEVVS